MDTVNINKYAPRYGFGNGAVRLRDEPIKLKAFDAAIWEVDGSDRWEDDGGYVPPILDEEAIAHNNAYIRVRGSKKQRAARKVRPIESVTIIREKLPVFPGQAIAAYEKMKQDEVDAVMKLKQKAEKKEQKAAIKVVKPKADSERDQKIDALQAEVERLRKMFGIK